MSMNLKKSRGNQVILKKGRENKKKNRKIDGMDIDKP